MTISVGFLVGHLKELLLLDHLSEVFGKQVWGFEKIFTANINCRTNEFRHQCICCQKFVIIPAYLEMLGTYELPKNPPENGR